MSAVRPARATVARTRAQLSQENSYVDLGSLCSDLEASGIGEVSARAGAVLKILGKYVVHSRRFPIDPEQKRIGLSVFFPLSLEAHKNRHQTNFRASTINAQVDWPAYRALAFSIDTAWDAFVKAFTERLV